jgi:hypothetical protein
MACQFPHDPYTEDWFDIGMIKNVDANKPEKEIPE